MANERIGRYEIQSEIGRGGMATVYLAHDPNFRRNVAIKLVSSSFQSDPMFRGRFEREAQLIAKIEHPAIVPVYDYGEYENNLYLVMRYMTGGSLAGKLKAGVFSLGEAAQILSQIAPALDAVHAQGIVHRDLKPGNILFDSFGNPAISDFGIAHFTAATSDLTGSAVIGTPAYMSPEQVRSDGDIDGRSDIYALGVILFEMLAGRGPFQATTPLNIAFKHLTDPVPSIQLLRPELPPEVDHILERALAKEREQRYSTAAELARDLRAVPERPSVENASRPLQDSVRDDEATEVDATEEYSAASLHSSGLEFDDSLSDLSKPQTVNPAPPASTGQSIREKPSGRLSLRPVHILLLAGVGVFLFFLCGSLGVFGTWAGLRGLFSAPTPTLSPSPTMPPAATPTSPAQEVILFSDDFSDPNSGWPVQAGYSYQPDGYHIAAGELGGVPWATISAAFDDSSMYVDAAPVREGLAGYYGLLCRLQTNQDFYYFAISNDGGYVIGKSKNGELLDLFPDGVRRSEVIKQGSQINRLKADCVGNTFRLYVNDVLLAEVTDPDFRSGASGILAAAVDNQEFEVRFDNFRITQTEP